MKLMAEKMYSNAANGKTIDNDFGYFNYHTYLLLKPGMELSTLSATLRNLHLRVKPEDTDVELPVYSHWRKCICTMPMALMVGYWYSTDIHYHCCFHPAHWLRELREPVNRKEPCCAPKK